MLITPRTYRKWERGERHRDNVTGVLAFCERYGVSYGWLFAGPDYAPPPRFRLRLVRLRIGGRAASLAAQPAIGP